jgi:hypothetical protein
MRKNSVRCTLKKEQCTMYIVIHVLHIIISNFLGECSWNSMAFNKIVKLKNIKHDSKPHI